MCPLSSHRKANGSKKAERNFLLPQWCCYRRVKWKRKKIHKNWISRRMNVPGFRQCTIAKASTASGKNVLCSVICTILPKIRQPKPVSPSLSQQTSIRKNLYAGLVSKSIIKLRQKIIIQWAFLREDINPNDNSRSIWMTMRKLFKPRSENRDEREKEENHSRTVSSFGEIILWVKMDSIFFSSWFQHSLKIDFPLNDIFSG